MQAGELLEIGHVQPPVADGDARASDTSRIPILHQAFPHAPVCPHVIRHAVGCCVLLIRCFPRRSLARVDLHPGLLAAALGFGKRAPPTPRGRTWRPPAHGASRCILVWTPRCLLGLPKDCAGRCPRLKPPRAVGDRADFAYDAHSLLPARLPLPRSPVHGLLLHPVRHSVIEMTIHICRADGRMRLVLAGAVAGARAGAILLPRERLPPDLGPRGRQPHAVLRASSVGDMVARRRLTGRLLHRRAGVFSGRLRPAEEAEA